MPLYLDTRGKSTLGIGVCGRCGLKMSLEELYSDPNAPGLYVCSYDLDQFDPWRLPPREADRLQLEHPRPDAAITVGPQPIAINQPQAAILDDSGLITTLTGNPIALAPPVTQLNPSTPWSANTAYGVGAQVTPTNPVGMAAAGNLFPLFLCIVPGMSGATAPAWTSTAGAEVGDGTVTWINMGLYLP